MIENQVMEQSTLQRWCIWHVEDRTSHEVWKQLYKSDI